MWSRRFLKSAKALRESKYPTWRVIVAFKGLFKRGAHQIGHAFGSLQRDVPDESVGDDHVHLAAVDVTSFDVADKIQRKCFNSWKDSRVSSLPLVSSSPMESNPTRGRSVPNMLRK